MKRFFLPLGAFFAAVVLTAPFWMDAQSVSQLAYSIIQNNGTPLTQRSTMNFTGGAVASDVAGVTTINVSTSGGTCATLGGDVTGSCAANTVSKVNNGSIPVSALVLGTNSSAQAIAASLQGSGDTKVLLAGTTSASTGVAFCTDANGGATTSGCTPGSTIGYGAIASLPGSCSGNAVYFTTDSPYIFNCNGSTYDAMAFGYKVVQPKLSNFTQLNAGSTDTTHGGILAYGARGGSGAFYSIAVPGTGAYYIDMAFTASGADIAPNGNLSFVIMPTSSATGACRYMGLGSLGSGVQTQVFEVSVSNCTTAAGFVSSNINLYSLATSPMYWVRMTDDGTTTRTFQVSTNPYQWQTIVSEPRTTQFTTGFVAFFVQLFQLAQSIHILHFNTCTGAPSAACY